nr:immunoglobulin light chain junction region [Macaca mulatta]
DYYCGLYRSRSTYIF